MMKTILRNAAWLLCVAVAGLLFACSNDDDAQEQGQKSYEKIAWFMRTNMYDKNGSVTLSRLGDYQQGEWYISAADGTKAGEYFTAMTGVAAPLRDTYEYTYLSEENGKRVQIVLKGTRGAVDGVYATFYFMVPGFDEIKLIHFVDF